jgi:hypothetical protein
MQIEKEDEENEIEGGDDGEGEDSDDGDLKHTYTEKVRLKLFPCFRTILNESSAIGESRSIYPGGTGSIRYWPIALNCHHS